jgi:hypothetical protein
MLRARSVIDDRPLSADRVPTLTEVVELDLPVPPPTRADGGQDGAAPETAAVDAPQVMADDFVLAGLEADAVAPRIASDVAAPASTAGTPESDGQAIEMAGSEGSALPDDASTSALAAAGEATEAPGPVAALEPRPEPVVAMPLSAAAPALPQALPAVDVDAVVGQVLAELMPRIDMLLESRLREALAPALARAADGLIRDTRVNLAVAVRDLVQEAVDRALQRRADR